MTEETIRSTSPRSRHRLIVALVVLLLLGLLVWRGWVMWQVRESRSRADTVAAEQRVSALEQRIETLRRDQRAQTQRIQDAAATNRVLRDEVLGLSQRGALLEESISRLADPSRHGAQALRLDEVELLLSQGQQRLSIADDLDGARRAYALADGALQGIDDPRLLNLRQTLAQERIALDALGAGPHAAVSLQLEKFGTALEKLPLQPPDVEAAGRPAWQRMLSPLVDVRPARGNTLIAPTQRLAGQAALQIELGLARAALERDDTVAFRAALLRVEHWLPKLWPDSPQRGQRRQELESLRSATLQPALPVLGSTLQQMRLLRNARVALPAPALSQASPPAAALPAPRPKVE